MPLIYVSLEQKKIVLSDMERKTHKLRFESDDHEAIGNWLATHPGWEFMCSSSTNHPEEYGFSEDFDVNGVMSKAVEHAYRKLAVVVEPGPMSEASAAVEKAAKKYLFGFPVPLLFVRSGKKKEDILLTFSEEELAHFVMGIKYASNLQVLAGSD